MSWMKPTARKAATYGAKYGPHAVVVWNVAGEHIQAAARAKAAEIAERRKAFAEAAAVVDGSVLRIVDHGTAVFVVFTGEARRVVPETVSAGPAIAHGSRQRVTPGSDANAVGQQAGRQRMRAAAQAQ
jgi:hypothetical protein